MASLIIGTSGFNKLQLGYEIDINDIRTRNCHIADSATGGIAGGDLLVMSGTTQVYTTATTTGDKVAGILLATNVKLDPQFPQSPGELKFMPGDAGACVIGGSVAVKLTGTAPDEGDAVYYDLVARAFTKSSSSNLACPNMKFRGITEGNTTVVEVLYA